MPGSCCVAWSGASEVGLDFLEGVAPSVARPCRTPRPLAEEVADPTRRFRHNGGGQDDSTSVVFYVHSPVHLRPPKVTWINAVTTTTTSHLGSVSQPIELAGQLEHPLYSLPRSKSACYGVQSSGTCERTCSAGPSSIACPPPCLQRFPSPDVRGPFCPFGITTFDLVFAFPLPFDDAAGTASGSSVSFTSSRSSARPVSKASAGAHRMGR